MPAKVAVTDGGALRGVLVDLEVLQERVGDTRWRPEE